MIDQYNYHIERIRFHLLKKNTLIVHGWFREDNPGKRSIEFYLDDKKIDYSLEIKDGVRVRQKYLIYNADISEEIICTLELPEHWERYKKLRIFTVQDGTSCSVAKIDVRSLAEQKKNLDYYIEQEQISNDKIQITGWALGNEPVEISVLDGADRVVKAGIKFSYRRDVMEIYQEGNEGDAAGFIIEAPIPADKKIKIVFQSADKTTIYETTENRIRYGKKNGLVQKAISYWKREGLLSTLGRIKRKIFQQKEDVSYEKWLKKHRISAEELEAQRAHTFSFEPMFSFVIPLYKTKEKYLRELIDSITAQTYRNWEICFADGSGREAALEGIICEYQKQYANIRYQMLKKNEGISENTNAAIRMAQGDFIVLADHDDTIAPDALYECARALNEDNTIDVIYSDEDKLDTSGKKYFDPHFKSDFNPDLLCSMNYICHLFVVKNSLIEQVGMLRKEFDGAQDHDFILRCCEKAQNICHIPKVLYHWRCHMDSTAENPESKLYAFEAGRKAVEEHYNRMGIPATVEHSSFYGMYHTKYHWQEQPLVSIVIPNKDHIKDLKKCMDSIDSKSVYRNYEFVIVENNSTKEETFAYYKELEKRENVTVLYYKGGFNYSRINNFGVAHAGGEYILLLNNDTEIINPDCIKELLDYCMRNDVGIVGAKLCYEDDTIQHAGVVIGFGGMAGHTFIGASRYDIGYMGRIICAQDYSAVTAACMMTKKSVYEAAGGLTEEFEVAFNDIDYCLKVRQLGKLVVYNPYAQLYHYESKSRGLEDTPEKVERFNGEVARFVERWHDLMKAGDPYYNPNLTLDKADFSLKP